MPLSMACAHPILFAAVAAIAIGVVVYQVVKENKTKQRISRNGGPYGPNGRNCDLTSDPNKLYTSSSTSGKTSSELRRRPGKNSSIQVKPCNDLTVKTSNTNIQKDGYNNQEDVKKTYFAKNINDKDSDSESNSSIQTTVMSISPKDAQSLGVDKKSNSCIESKHSSETYMLNRKEEIYKRKVCEYLKHDNDNFNNGNDLDSVCDENAEFSESHSSNSSSSNADAKKNSYV